MPGLSVKTNPLISRTLATPAGIGHAADDVGNSSMPFAQSLSSGLRNLDASVTKLWTTLRGTSPDVREIKVTDSTGKVVAFLGDFEFNGVVTRNYFSELHVGDPLGTGDPTQAILNVTPDGKITLGGSGWLDVLDPYGADAAWMGTQFDTEPVTGAADNGSGLIRLTIAGHTLLTGDVVRVLNVGGVPNATGVRTVTKIDANHVDLQNTVFVGTYTSGGTVDRLLHVTGAVDNGSGLIRLTVTAHGYESGDRVSIVTVGGVPNATGQWTITVITANTFDLAGSAFAGTYTSGGLCIRYFAGGLFQTIAIGPSFPNYRLRAFADGSLKIKDAEITLDGTGATIIFDPTTGDIEVVATGVPPNNRVRIQSGEIDFDQVGAGASGITSQLLPAKIILGLDPINNYQISLGETPGLQIFANTDSFGFSQLIDLWGYTGAFDFGPVVSCHQSGGDPVTPIATQPADTLGGIITWGFDGVGESIYAAGIRMRATEAHTSTAHGAQIIFETTPNGSTTSSIVGIISHAGLFRLGSATAPGYACDVTGDANVSGVYRVAGAAGIGAVRQFGGGLNLTSDPTAVRGTPSIGQSNFTALTGASLTLISNTFTGGILTS